MRRMGIAVHGRDFGGASGGRPVSGKAGGRGIEDDGDVLAATWTRRNGHAGGHLSHDVEATAVEGVGVGDPLLGQGGVLVVDHSDESGRDPLDQATGSLGGCAVRLAGVPHRVGEELRHHEPEVHSQVVEAPHAHTLHQNVPGVMDRALRHVKVQVHLARPSVKDAARLFGEGGIEGSRRHVWSSSVDLKPRHGAPVAVCTGCAPVSNH